MRQRINLGKKEVRWGHLARDAHGQTFVETAFILLVFFLLTIGLIEFARGIYMYNSLAHAVRDAARYAIVHGARSANPATANEIRDLIRNRGGIPSNATITTTWDGNSVPTDNNNQEDIVQIRGQATFLPLFPALGGIDFLLLEW